MKLIDFAFIVFSLIVAAISYIASASLIFPIGVGLIYILYYFIFCRRKLKKYRKKVNVIHCCYHFINSFIVTLSVKESLDDAYESGIRLENKDFKEETDNIESMPTYDRIVYLRSYFNLAVYKMFINILNLYQDQGGNILNISDSLMRETTRTEKALADSTSIGERRLFEFVVLWVITFGILIFLRFGVSDFYTRMLNSMIFIILLAIFFIIVLASFHLFLTRYVSLSIKEDTSL